MYACREALKHLESLDTEDALMEIVAGTFELMDNIKKGRRRTVDFYLTENMDTLFQNYIKRMDRISTVLDAQTMIHTMEYYFEKNHSKVFKEMNKRFNTNIGIE